MRAIQFGRDMRRQTTAPQRIGGVLGVRGRGKKISAQGKKYFCFAFMHCLNRMYCVVAVFARWFEVKFCGQLVEKLLARLFPNSHRAVTLNVAVTAHRTKTCTRLAELAAQKHQVDDLLYVADRVLMLC